MHSAVRADDLPYDEACVIACEKQRDRCDLFRRADASERRHLNHERAHIVGEIVENGCFDPSRSDAVDANPIRGDFLRHAFREGYDPAFCRVVAGRAGQRLDNFLLGELKGAPRSLIYKVVRSGHVPVNGGRANAERRL